MTDQEIICTFMEPDYAKSRQRADERPSHKSDGDWWSHTNPQSCWLTRKLDLDALWEVEERLTDEQFQAYWAEFAKEVGVLTVRNSIHATAGQKIKALAAVLRSLVDRP